MPDFDLSILIAVKDRSRVMCSRKVLKLLPNCLASIVSAQECLPQIRLEVVIADFCSTDWPLEEWVGSLQEHPVMRVYPLCRYNYPVNVITVKEKWSLGRGRNIAADHARSDLFFFLDADMLLGAKTLETCYQLAQKGNAVFPLPTGYVNQEHTKAFPMEFAKGNCCVSRDTWKRAGKWREWPFWGPEDLYFYDECKKVGPVVRPNAPDLIHQWHPDSLRGEIRKPMNFVPAPGEEGIAV